MLVPFATLPHPRRTWLMTGLLVAAAVCLYLMGRVWTPQAQHWVLYGDPAASPADLATPLKLVGVTAPVEKTWDGLDKIRSDGDVGRELVLVLLDDLFALSYGGGVGLLLLAASRGAYRNGYLPKFGVNLLRFSAACFPVAGAFDLVENQLVAVLLFMDRGSTGDTLIFIVRYCAIPKYDLTFVLGPVLVLLAVVIALVWRMRQWITAK